jgi:RNA polymerase sigma factor (sigma-70 family)
MPDAAARGDRSRDEALVLAVRSGDPDAFGALFERWFDRVYDVARNVLHDDHAAADIAQDTFVTAWRQLDRLGDPASFGGWVLRIGRNRALDRLRQATRTRTTGADVIEPVHDEGRASVAAIPAATDPADVAVATERDELVRAAVTALGPRDASLVDLHLRHGLSPAEIAEELGVTANTAHQQLFRMRERLGNAIGSWLLFRRGRPECPALAAALGGAARFDAGALATIERHGRRCDACTARRAVLTDPARLFAATPIALVPVALRGGVTARLADLGVPVSRSAAGAGRPTEPADGPASSSVADEPTVPIRRPGGRATTRARLVAIGSAAVVVAAAIVGWLAFGGDDDTAPSPAAIVAASESTTPTSSTPDSTSPPADTSPPETTLADAGRSGDDPLGRDVVAPPGDAPTPKQPDALVVTTTQPGTTAPAPPDAASPNPTAPPPAVTNPPPAAPLVAVTAAPTTPPPTSPPTAPPTAPPTPAPTTTAPTPPVVTGFTVGAGPGGLLCADPAATPRRFQWTSAHATSATLTIAGTPRSVPLSGPYDACAASGATATIAVSGPGGADSRSIAVP